jgi:adenosine deaminase/adenosine deaminase CECR1
MRRISTLIFAAKMHNELKLMTQISMMRYQNYVLRFMELLIFKNLVIAFFISATSDLMVGVNIVSPENGETSMKDYWLHM